MPILFLKGLHPQLVRLELHLKHPILLLERFDSFMELLSRDGARGHHYRPIRNRSGITLTRRISHDDDDDMLLLYCRRLLQSTRNDVDLLKSISNNTELILCSKNKEQCIQSFTFLFDKSLHTPIPHKLTKQLTKTINLVVK
jgi:hypothetical protein